MFFAGLVIGIPIGIFIGFVGTIWAIDKGIIEIVEDYEKEDVE